MGGDEASCGGLEQEVVVVELGKENMQEPKEAQHREETNEEQEKQNHKQKIHVRCIDLCFSL